MKKTILNILLVSTIVFSFSSCKKDKEEEAGPASYFSIGDGSKKSLTKGLIEYGSNPSTLPI